MSKQQNVPMAVCGWSSGYVIGDNGISYLEGRILTIVESLGLRDTQEKAVKDLLRNELWTVIREQAQWISSEEHTKLRRAHQENILVPASRSK